MNLNKHPPSKTLSERKLKQLANPWIAKGIKTSIKVKNRLYALGKTNEYKYYRNKLNTLIRTSKYDYYFTYFENNMANIKKTYEGVEARTLEMSYQRK